MNYLLLFLFSISGGVFLISCGYSPYSATGARPFQEGVRQGDLVPMGGDLSTSLSSRPRANVPDINPINSNQDDSSKQNPGAEELEAPQAKKSKTVKEPLMSFRDLSLKIQLDPTEVNAAEGDVSHQPQIKVELNGKYKISQNQHILKLSRTLNRYHSQTGVDILEANHETKVKWAFILANAKLNLAAQIYCLKSWSCNTVKVRMIWFESNVRHTQLFLVKNTFLKNNDNESIKAEVDHNNSSLSNDDDHNHSEETSPKLLESEPIFQSTGPLHLPSNKDFFVSDGSIPKTETEVANENFLIQLDRELQIHREQRASYGVQSIQSYEGLDTSQLYFNFLSAPQNNFYASEVSSVSEGTTNDGTLTFADQLMPSFLVGSTSVSEPYVVARGDTTKSFGNTSLVRLLEAVSLDMENKSAPHKTCIGNLSKESGGPLSPHISHQNGLDADIYFFQKTNVPTQQCGFDIVEKPELFSDHLNYEFIKSLYRNAQAQVPGTSIQVSYLSIVLVNQIVKDRLCKYARAVDGELLDQKGSEPYEAMKRLRPWDGHTDHFHVRLNCYQYGCSESESRNIESSGC